MSWSAHTRLAWWGPPGKWLFGTCFRGVFYSLEGREEREKKKGETWPKNDIPPTLICSPFEQCMRASRGVGNRSGCEGV